MKYFSFLVRHSKLIDMKIAWILGFALLLAACNNETEEAKPEYKVVRQYKDDSGETYTELGYYPDDMRAYIANYVEEKLQGRFIEFYHNGQQKLEKHFSRGEAHGRETGWYENGTQSSIANLVDGKLHGEVKTWCENGKLKSVRYYQYGYPVGDWTIYYCNGQIHRKGTYKYTPIGKHYVYLENGQIDSIITYEKGEIASVSRQEEAAGQEVSPPK